MIMTDRYRTWYGPFLIMLAAGLWAADALFRTELTKSMSSASIVFFEHVIGFVLLSPFLVKGWSKIKALKGRTWGWLVLLTIVSSVLGTLLFTEALVRSFSLGDFATPILLQKLQPIFVILLAAMFLRERVTFRFFALVIIALIGSYLISFGAQGIDLSISDKEVVYLLAIGAAFAWGSGTVMSKNILNTLSFAQATALRFMLAIPVSAVAVVLLGQSVAPSLITTGALWRFLIIAFTTGAGAVLLYYRGLAMTEAKVATICELVFPVVSIIIAITALNPFGDPQALSLANIFGILLLLIAMLVIVFDYHVDKRLPTMQEV